MSAELETDAQLEIGHVLFMDIVGFSKLLVDQQAECAHRLNQIVRNTDQFRAAEAGGRLIRLPTGDGMVLVFFKSPETPTRCAMEIASALKGASFSLRMGIHSGAVNQVVDVDGRSNLAGSGINLAQRVMDCGDAGHILLSKRAAEDLEQHSKWRPRLHPLGEFEVKHGVKIEVVSLYTDEVGNPALPEKLKKKKATAPIARFIKPLIRATLIVAVGAAGIWFFRHRGESGSAGPALAAIFPGKGVAVLPFKPLVASNRDEVLEAGMADTLIAKLSTSREMVVPSLASTRKYADQQQDSVATGRALRVNSVLEGNLQKAGDRIRVTARLISVPDGRSIWSGTFDEKFTDVFQVEDAIAEKVAAALQLRLSEEEQQRLTKRYTQNAEAYQLYLRGRFYWNKYTVEGFKKSIDYFKQATEKDPTYALAYSGLADAYSLLGEYAAESAKNTFPLARAHAEKALQLDENLSEAHLSLGIVKLFYDWDLPAAERELRRAKELDPRDAQVYHFYGHYLELVKRFDEAIAETERGVELDPTILVINSELGYGYYMARKFEQAAAQHRKTLEMDPNFVFASYCLADDYIQMGNLPEALAELNRTRPISQDWSWIVAGIGYVDAMLGKRAEALQIINELTIRSNREYIDPVFIAYIYIYLGDKDQAFAWMEKGVQERSGQILWLRIEPLFDPLRSDPRFDEMVRRMGLK